MLLSIFYFLLAGIAEIGGGYLVWLYMRDDKSPLYLLVGAIILILYGIIPKFNQRPVLARSMLHTAVYLLPSQSYGVGSSMVCDQICMTSSAVLYAL